MIDSVFRSCLKNMNETLVPNKIEKKSLNVNWIELFLSDINQSNDSLEA